MTVKILLNFDKGTTRLAGNPYGRKEFQLQAKDKIDYTATNIIVFPNQIEKIASSFIQGFFAEIVEKVGYAKFDEVVKIEAKDDELANTIHSDLFV